MNQKFEELTAEVKQDDIPHQEVGEVLVASAGVEIVEIQYSHPAEDNPQIVLSCN